MTEVANKENIGAAMGRIPSGVFVVTTQHDGQKIGMMASWIAQVGFEPPCITLAVNPDREIFKAIQASKKFSVNVLSGDNLGLMRAFSKYSPDQFDDVKGTETEYGVTLDETVAVMHCRLKDIYPAADHHLVVAEVVDGEYLDHEQAPMVHLRKSGFSY